MASTSFAPDLFNDRTESSGTAALGWMLTALPLPVLAIFAFMWDAGPFEPETGITLEFVNPLFFFALLMAVYWLPAAKWGRGDVLRVGLANWLLLAIPLSVWLLGGLVMELATNFSAVCEQQGISQEMGLPCFGFDAYCAPAPSDCMKLTNPFRDPLYTLVFIHLPLLLLALSMVTRIVISRRRYAEGA